MDCFQTHKPSQEDERSRATMWDVPRFAEYHDYNIIIVENVVEAREWILWSTWLMAMHNLGYHHKCCYFNSMHFHPTPQSRDRMYVVFWKKGNPAPDLELRPIGHCQSCQQDVECYQWWKNQKKKWGKYQTQYLYRCSQCNEVVEPYYFASFNIIDWTIPGRPVNVAVRSDNTLRRIQYGLDRFGHQLLSIGHSTPTSAALVMPYYINTDHPLGKDNIAVRHSSRPLRTQTTAHTTGIVLPVPIIIENNGQSKARCCSKPAPCVTTQIKHGILNPEAVRGFLTYYNGGSDLISNFSDPVGTITTVDRVGLVRCKRPTIEECTYRTIKPHEVKAAMAFEDSYIVLGNAKQKVKQLGNAVTPPVMKFLTSRAIKTLI